MSANVGVDGAYLGGSVMDTPPWCPEWRTAPQGHAPCDMALQHD